MKFRTEPKKCPALVGFTIKGEARLIYCGQWSCEHCRKIISRKWAIRVKTHLQADKDYTGDTWYMLTLTLGSGYKDVFKAFKGLRKLWNRLRMHINRETGSHWQYCAFVEGQPHRDNMPHFHVIMNIAPHGVYGKRGTITKHATHTFAHKLGWGYEADMKAVEGDKASWYVSKYTSKGAGTVPKGFRRVRTSRGWAKLPKDPARMLIVRAKTEQIQDYILRVADITGREMDDLYEAWEIAQERLLDAQAGHID